MGRSASHIALECALQTQINLVIIGEEVEAKKQTLQEIVLTMADMISERAKHNRDYGIINITYNSKLCYRCNTCSRRISRVHP